MLAAVIVILASAMLIGGYMAWLAGRRRPAPLRSGLTHAGLALTGTGLLCWRVIAGPTAPLLTNALVLLGLTATGGTLLLALRHPEHPQPVVIVGLHALLAIAALALLVVAMFVG
jgi:hypothetical protein